MPVIKQEEQEPDQFTMRLDEHGKITFVDQRAHQLLGQKTDEIVGKHLWKCFHSADELLISEAFRQMMSTGGQSPAFKVSSS